MHSPALASGIQSSGKSVNAEEWFEDFNRNVSGQLNVSFVDSGSPICSECTYNNMFMKDPPIYLQPISSLDNHSACAALSVPLCHRSLNSVHHPLSNSLATSRLDMSESDSEDYRSVIDDLTVQNKELKQRLKLYKKLHSSHLQRDKLFEVSVYGLPAHRKRELEAILQSFAARVDEDLEKPLPLPSLLGAYHSLDSTSSCYEALSSTSYSRPVDSTYASMSASGHTSGSPPHHKGSRRPERRRRSVKGNDHNIHCYLQDIPKGMLLRRLPDITEKAKKKPVVRRLEQSFTGIIASTGLYSQSLQQQEVSRSAANADRTASKASGVKISAEGVREARIRPANIEILASLPYDTMSSSHGRYREESEDSGSGGANSNSDRTPDQRLTRPLDLDPYRAQVLAENFQYIRHLCIASPPRCATLPSEVTQDWIYLDLLTSMAQLHTINVTPEFVRMAVVEISTKLDLSGDGSKIRWKGGTEGTRMRSDSSGSWSSPDYKNESGNQMYPKPKRRKLADHQPRIPYGADGLRKPRLLGRISSTKPLGYKPVVFHRTHQEEVPEDYAPDSDSCRSLESFEDVAVERNRREEGAITYYNGAPFCTDLSGDSNLAPCHDPEFSDSGADILGCPPFADTYSDLCADHALTDANYLSESAGLDQQSMDIDSMAGFEDMGSGPNANPSTPVTI